MKILIIGSGGREHAIAWKIAQNKKVSKIYMAPGNASQQMMSVCENVDLHQIDDLLRFAKKHQVDLTIVGSEALLVEGIVDRFMSEGLAIFGPDKKAALLEGSKAFSKAFMKKYGIRTAPSETFTDYEKAIKYIETCDIPVVIKASGLAAGKGVVICHTREEAQVTLKEMMLDKVFSIAGETVVIEAFLEGVEVSVLSVTDGKTILPFISAKDHKKVGEGDTGLNTGGMGVIAPNPYYTHDVEQQFIQHVLQPTLNGLKAEGMCFAGVIFFGLMICGGEVYLLEYNMRLGDPETQAILPLLDNDLLDIIEAARSQTLNEITLQWKDAHTCCVVLSSGGYPKDYKKGHVITGIDKVTELSGVHLFFAGVGFNDGQYVNSGGRVLNVVAVDNSLMLAQTKAYQALKGISFKDMYYRKDIGQLK